MPLLLKSFIYCINFMSETTVASHDLIIFISSVKKQERLVSNGISSYESTHALGAKQIDQFEKT